MGDYEGSIYIGKYKVVNSLVCSLSINFYEFSFSYI